MAPYTHSVTQALELEMIRTDVEFCRQLILESAVKNSSGILPFGLTPYLSLFVIETYNYFGSRVPGFSNLAKRQHQNILRASRTRIKLYDRKQDISSLMDHLEWINDFSRGWMNCGHGGWLGWLKKWVQPDMGLYFYGDHLVSTTQAAFFNLGFANGDIATTQQGEPIGLKELSQSVGRDIGEYISFLSNEFAKALGAPATVLCTYQLSESPFRLTDKNTISFLRDLDSSNTPLHINSCLLLSLTTVNFLIHVFRRLVVDDPNTWFKLKFLTLYHVVVSLTALQNGFYTSGLSQNSKDVLAHLLDDRELKTLRSKSAFRNIMVHYEIRDVPENRLTMDIPYFGLLEHFFAGASFTTVNDLVNRQLLRISAALEDWMKTKPHSH
jgi:hypothetical protein